jgi:hypothetical protein
MSGKPSLISEPTRRLVGRWRNPKAVSNAANRLTLACIDGKLDAAQSSTAAAFLRISHDALQLQQERVS